MAEQSAAASTSGDSSFECSVCLRLLYEPATLACGHSFCRRCLLQCMQRTLKCPTCRCDVEAQPATSIALAHALQLLCPREVAERAREERSAEPQPQLEGLRSLPLFVLEPLLPGQSIHLHIFEPRYIRLTQRALTEGALEKSFGMVAVSHRGLSQFGVTAKIVDWSEAPRGRYFLTVVGERRFRILRAWDVDGYRNAEIAWARDATLEPEAVAMSSATSATEVVATATERAALPGKLLARECKTAISEWTAAVAQGWERRTGQIDTLLHDLGPAPEDDELERLGLWCLPTFSRLRSPSFRHLPPSPASSRLLPSSSRCAALLNPLPPLGVAPEIRLQALECTDSVERLRLVLIAADSSLQHMRTPKFRLGNFLFGGGVWRFLGRGLRRHAEVCAGSFQRVPSSGLFHVPREPSRARPTRSLFATAQAGVRVRCTQVGGLRGRVYPTWVLATAFLTSLCLALNWGCKELLPAGWGAEGVCQAMNWSGLLVPWNDEAIDAATEGQFGRWILPLVAIIATLCSVVYAQSVL